METKADTKSKPRKKTKSRIIKLVLALFVLLILAGIFFVPVYISSEKGRKTILAKINSGLDGRADFAALSMGWLKGIKITDFSFNDNANSLSVNIKQIATKPHYGSLLFGQLSFGETVIDEPRIEINLKDKTGEAGDETSNTGEKAKAVAGGKSVGLPIKRIDLVVKDGSVKVTDSKATTVEISQINSRVRLRPPGQQSTFDVNMEVIGQGKKSKINTSGQLKPSTRSGWTLEGTSGEMTIEVNDLDIETLGPFFYLAGIEVEATGKISVNIKSELRDGKLTKLSGTVSGKNLDITAEHLKGDRFYTENLSADIELRSSDELIEIDKLDVKTDWLNINVSGTVPKAVGTMEELLKPDSPHTLKGEFYCDLAAATSLMPNTLKIKEGMKITSGQLSGTVDTVIIDGVKKIRGQVSISDLKGIVDGRIIALSEPIRAATLISSEGEGIINFDMLKVSSSFAKIDCSGTAKSLKYVAEMDIARFQKELGQFVDMGEYKMAGEIVEQGEISIGDEEITAAGTAVINNFRVSSKDGTVATEPRMDIIFDVGWEQKKSIINIGVISARASLGQIEIKDAVIGYGQEAGRPLDVVLTAKGIDLKKLQPFAVLFANFPAEMQMAGIAESDISIKSDKGIYKIATDTTKISNFRLTSPDKKAFEQKEVSFVGRAEVNPAKKTYSATWELISPQIKIKGEYGQTSKNGKTKINGKAELDYDWSAISAIVSPFLPAELNLEGKRKDTITFSSEYPEGQTDKLLANLNSKGKIGFDKAEFMGLNFESTEVDIQIVKGLLKIAPFSVKVNEGQLNFAGGADFNKKPALFETSRQLEIIKDVQINEEMSKKLLKYLNPIFANLLNVSGVANFDCEKLAIPLTGGEKNDIEVIGTVSMSNVRLQGSGLLSQILSVGGGGTRGQNITIHPTKFVVKGGFVKYEDMQIDVGDNSINFKGVIGLEDKSLDMEVLLPYTTAGKTVRVGKKTKGSRIAIHLGGTIDNPKLDLSKLAEMLLKDTLEKVIEKEGMKLLENLFKR